MAASKGELLKKMGKAAAMSLVPGASLGAGIAGIAGRARRKKMGQAKEDFMSEEQRKSSPRSSAPVEKSYPTSAPASSKRPKARAEPVRPKARPAKIEQEAAEAAAVAQGNKEALRRVKEMEKKKDGGSLKSVPSGNKGLSKLPTGVRNSMGYMKSGGSVKKMGMGGSMCRGMGAATRGGKFTRDG